MKPELIVMLTYNDKTVENALELFEEMPIVRYQILAPTHSEKAPMTASAFSGKPRVAYLVTRSAGTDTSTITSFRELLSSR